MRLNINGFFDIKTPNNFIKFNFFKIIFFHFFCTKNGPIYVKSHMFEVIN